MNRRTFIKVAAVSFASFLTGCGVDSKKNLPIKFLRQIVTKDISGSRCIMWQVDAPLKNPTVEVKVNGSTKIFPAIDSTFSDDGKENIQYTAQIEVGDEYRIIDGDAAGDWHKLTIPNDKSFKAIKTFCSIELTDAPNGRKVFRKSEKFLCRSLNRLARTRHSRRICTPTGIADA